MSPAQGPLLPHSASPCLPAHKLCMPQYWGVSGILSMNSKIADFCFLPFHLLFPRAKQLQPPMGRCSGSGGSSCSQPQGAEFQLFGMPMTPCQISQPRPASLLPCCHSYPTEVCWQEGWNQAVVSSGGCSSRVSAETALQGPLCLTSAPSEASRAFGPLLGGSSCGGSRNRRLWKPPIPCTLELCCQLWGLWNTSSSCRPCRAVVGSLGQLQFHPWALGGGAKLGMELGQNKPSAPTCSAG